MRRSAAAACALAMSLFLATAGNPMPVDAAGSTYIDISNTAPKVGDTVTVKVRATQPDTLSISYDNTKLQLQGTTGGTQSGNKITYNGSTVTLTFQVTGDGNASVVVKPYTQDVAGSSVNLKVASQAPQQPAVSDQPAEPEQPQQPAQDPNVDTTPDFQVDNANYTISEKFQDSEIPAGFTADHQSIHNYNYKVLKNGDVTLLYLKPSENLSSAGSFWVYDAGSDSVSQISRVGDASSYVMILTPQEVPEGLTAQDVTAGDSSIAGYVTSDGKTYLYGLDQTGRTGWYQYDATAGTWSAVDDIAAALKPARENPAESDSSSTSEKQEEHESKNATAKMSPILAKWNSLPHILQIGCGALLIALILLIVWLSRRRSAKSNRKRTGVVPDEMTVLTPDDEDSSDEEKSPEGEVFDGEAVLEEDSEAAEDTQEDQDMASEETASKSTSAEEPAPETEEPASEPEESEPFVGASVDESQAASDDDDFETAVVDIGDEVEAPADELDDLLASLDEEDEAEAAANTVDRDVIVPKTPSQDEPAEASAVTDEAWNTVPHEETREERLKRLSSKFDTGMIIEMDDEDEKPDEKTAPVEETQEAEPDEASDAASVEPAIELEEADEFETPDDRTEELPQQEEVPESDELVMEIGPDIDEEPAIEEAPTEAAPEEEMAQADAEESSSADIEPSEPMEESVPEESPAADEAPEAWAVPESAEEPKSEEETAESADDWEAVSYEDEAADDGSISVAAENRGSNDAVLGAVADAVSRADEEKKALEAEIAHEQPEAAPEPSGTPVEDDDEIPELRVIDFNDL